MGVYVGAGNRVSRYFGMATSPLPYVGAGVLFAATTTPPTFVAATTFQSGTGALTINFSGTGLQAGDLLVISVEDANQAVTTPTGFTPAPSSPQSIGTAAAAGGVRQTLFLKKAVGTETTVAIADSGDHTTAIGYVFRGVDTSTAVNLLQNSNDLTNGTYWHTFPDTSAQIAAGNLLTITGVTAQADKGIYTASFTTLTSGQTYTLLYDAQTTSGTSVFASNIYYEAPSGNVDNFSPDRTATATVQRFKHTITLPAGVTFTNLGFCSGSAMGDVAVKITRVQLVQGDVDITYPYVASTNAAATQFTGVNASAGSTQSAVTGWSFAGVSSTVDNCLICHFIADDRDAASTSNLSGIANTNLTDLTKRFDQTVTAGQGGGLALITGVKATAGATGNTTATHVSNTNACVTLALAPPPSESSSIPWTPDNLSVAPLVVMDASQITWSGTAFGSLANTGSLGGSFTTFLGTPTKAAGDANGYDAIAFAANSGISLPSAAMPSGNLFVFYVGKKTGAPTAAGFGAVIAQAYSAPGFLLADQVAATYTLATSDTAYSGDKAIFGWPSGTNASDHDVIVTPPSDDGAYHITNVKTGTENLWHHDGTLLTPRSQTPHSLPGQTSDLTIGTDGYSSLHWNGNLAYLIILQDPTTDEIQRLQGWASWRFGISLPYGHPYKGAAPLVGVTPDATRGGWNKTSLEAGLMTFSNNDRTVVGNNSGGTGDNRCYSKASKSTGKWFASVSIDAREYGDVSVCDSGDHNYVHYDYQGTIWSSAGTVLATLSGYTAPCIIDVQCDTDNHLVWFRLNGGYWNGNAAYDPDAGTGGFALPVSTDPYHLKVQIPYFADSQRTLNTGTAAFTYPPSSTFPALQA